MDNFLYGYESFSQNPFGFNEDLVDWLGENDQPGPDPDEPMDQEENALNLQNAPRESNELIFNDAGAQAAFPLTSIPLEQAGAVAAVRNPTNPSHTFSFHETEFHPDATIGDLYWDDHVHHTGRRFSARGFLGLSANLLHPDEKTYATICRKIKQNEQKAGSACLDVDKMQTIEEFRKTQKQGMAAIKASPTTGLRETLFRTLIGSLKFLLIYDENLLLQDTCIRTIEIPHLHLFQIFNFWKLSIDSEEKQGLLLEAVQHFCYFIKAQKPPFYFFKDDSFQEWLEAALGSVIKENSWIAKNLVPRSKISSKSGDESARVTSFSKATEVLAPRFIHGAILTETQELLLHSLQTECDEIMTFSNTAISELFEEIQFRAPYCKEIKTKEYVFSKRFIPSGVRKKTSEMYDVHSIEVHIARFFLTYIAKSSQTHCWGHAKEDNSSLQKQYKITSLKGLFCASMTELEVGKVENLKPKDETQSRILEEVLKSTHDAYKKIFVVDGSYRPCYQTCQSREISFAKDLQAIEMPESWDTLHLEQRQCAINYLNNLMSQFNSIEKKLKMATTLTGNKKPTVWRMDLANFAVHECFFPMIKKSIPDEIEDRTILFVLNRFFKIFNIFCSDVVLYKNGFAQTDEDQRILNLIALGAPSSSSRVSYTGMTNTNKLFSFINKTKKQEFTKYIENLKAFDRELDLKFAPRTALVISKKREQKYGIVHVELLADEFGFCDINLRPSLDMQTSQFISDHCCYTTSSYGTIEDIMPVLKFIAERWKNGDFIVPVFADALVKNQSATKQSKGLESCIADKSDNTRLARMRRARLTASTPALTKFINEQAQAAQSKKKNSDKNDETEALLLSQSAITLPNFLLELQLLKSEDFFCNIVADSVIAAYQEAESEKYQKQANSARLQFFGVPNDGALIVEQRHRKPHLIDTLRQEQKEGIARFEVWKESGCGGIIADEPGMGKTRTASEILIRMLQEFPERPCFVIAPSLVKRQWANEFFNPLKESAINLCKKIFFSTQDPALRKQAQAMQKKLLPDKLWIKLKTANENEITEEDLTRFKLFQKFLENFPGNPVHTIESPEGFKKLLKKAKTEPLKGIFVMQYSYVENHFEPTNPKPFKDLNPSIIIIDEAHELISMTENEKMSRTTRFDFLFRQWENCPKIALTATPIVNNLFDICDLMTLLTNKERNLNAAEHFEGILSQLANKIVEFKTKFEDALNPETEFTEEHFNAQMENYRNEIFYLGTRATYAFTWLKEKMINPRLSRAIRVENNASENNSQELIKRNFSLKITPTKKQNEIHGKILEAHHDSFFKFTSLVSALLIHPDLIAIEKDGKIKAQKIEILKNNIGKQTSIKKYIEQSGLLTALFLEKHFQVGNTPAMSIKDAMEKDERAIIFVTQVMHAEFIKAIAKKHFGLKQRQMFVAHSQNPNSDEDIEAFKQLKGKGILVLLPKTGGAGLNFTNVALNILAAVGWTHKDYVQCGGRHQRGIGEKYLGHVAYPFDSSLHVANIIKKKELLSEAFLDMTPIAQSNFGEVLSNILKIAEATVLACREHCKFSEKWNDLFAGALKKIMERVGSAEELWNKYEEIKARAERGLIDADQSNGIDESYQNELMIVESVTDAQQDSEEEICILEELSSKPALKRPASVEISAELNKRPCLTLPPPPSNPPGIGNNRNAMTPPMQVWQQHFPMNGMQATMTPVGRAHPQSRQQNSIPPIGHPIAWGQHHTTVAPFGKPHKPLSIQQQQFRPSITPTFIPSGHTPTVQYGTLFYPQVILQQQFPPSIAPIITHRVNATPTPSQTPYQPQRIQQQLPPATAWSLGMPTPSIQQQPDQTMQFNPKDHA